MQCNSDYTACNIAGLTLGNNIEIPTNIIGQNNKPSEATKLFIESIENCAEFSITGWMWSNRAEVVSNKLRHSEIEQNTEHSASMKLRLYVHSVSYDK